ncbi:MAG: QueT transporter family protein [Oscillospiraceae bacterium]|nr:QueT transporter family protein [Oscillospiraceae bacterium]
MSKTKKTVLSGLVIAMYVVIMYFTQSFAFGAYQIRIATSLYSLSYLFPFMVIPLSLANCIGNILGGNLWDIVGGFAAGFVTSGGIYLLSRYKLPKFSVIPLIILGPGLMVPIWLSFITGVPYPVLALSLCIGQIVPGVMGYFLILTLSGILKKDIPEENHTQKNRPGAYRPKIK